MKQQDFHVIIIGGGIGGLCLAQGLKKAGIRFSIYERNRDNDSWLEGYRINIHSVGSQALYQCLPKELWQAFLAGVGDPHEDLGFVTENLAELVVIDADWRVGHTQDPSRMEYAVGRKMLRYILQAGLEEYTTFGKTFVRYEQLPDGRVKALFEDGTSKTGNVLIGADGANSRVRQQLLPHAQRVDTDAVAAAGKLMLTPATRKWLPEALASRMNVIMPLDKYFFFNAVFDHSEKNVHSTEAIRTAAINAGIEPERFFSSSEDYILWSFIANKREFAQDLNEVYTDVVGTVLDKITDWHPALQRMIRESEPSSVSIFPLKAMRPFSNWQPGSVTILGDAAHNMPPVYGMGANMALHDALILYRQLSKVAAGQSELSAALFTYQEKMLKDGFKALNASVSYTRQASGYNRFQRFFARMWFRLCTAFEPLKKKSFAGQWDDLIVVE